MFYGGAKGPLKRRGENKKEVVMIMHLFSYLGCVKEELT